MSLFLRLTIAMVALVLLTGSVIGLIAYRNIEQVVIPEALQQINTETQLKAQQLEASARNAGSDAVAFASAVAVEGIVRDSLGIGPNDGISLDQWRERLARRFVAELKTKAVYSQFRLIGIADSGRELIRVDREGPGGSIRIVPNDELQPKDDRDFFRRAIAQPPGEAYVSQVELNREHDEIERPFVPTMHAAAVILRPDGKPFGAIVINLDMRGAFDRLRAPLRGGGGVYLVNETGDFLNHPDRKREFEFEFGVPFRVIDQFPELAGSLSEANGGDSPVVSDREGHRFGIGIVSVRLAGGPRVTVIDAVPYVRVIAAALTMRNSILVGGLLALFSAVVLALMLARSLTRPLVQMQAAVEGFARNQTLQPVPVDAGGEIGVLARAFHAMTQEIRSQATSLKKEIRERRRMFDSSIDLILITDRAGNFVRVSPSCQAILGYKPEEMIGKNGIDFVYPEDLAPTREEMRLARRGKALRNFETRYLHKDGHPVTLAWSGVWSEPEQSHFFIGRDMTEAKWAEEAIRDSERMARAVIDTALDAFIQHDEDGIILEWSPQAEMVFGWPREEAIGKHLAQLIVPAEMRELHSKQFADQVRMARETGSGVRFEAENERIDGTRIRVEVAVTPLKRRNGYVFNGFVRDITEKVANEEKLRHSQKMEAIGQLTGGIAHDFNNMLTVITGTIEILAEGVAERPELVAITKLIAEAADRGAELTSHLLAFARKQPLRPRETDVNALVAGVEKLFRPVLGENIEIVSQFTPDIWPAFADHSQLTTALLNLAVNARDAMPGGGKLTVETDNVVLEESYTRNHRDLQPGEYVMIAITDTGSGIPEDIRAKVFEPFFTTKEAGKGTGLGLSMVYGFVKQSGGHIMIYSEEGQGTSVRIYLPRASAQLPAAGAEEKPAAPQGGNETVLVVEDDPLVRGYVVTQLETLGYRTLRAANAAEAMAVIDAGTPFDLLFTDVIMPGAMNGRQLADEVAERRPGVKVLFTSGYTETALIHHGRLDAGVMLLNKPYRKSELARMLRSALAA